MLWLIGTAFALCKFLTLTTSGGFTRVLRENCDLLGFGGVWALREIPGPNRQDKFDPKKNREKIYFIFRCGFEKYVFVKMERFFVRFRPLVPPIGAVRSEKT